MTRRSKREVEHALDALGDGSSMIGVHPETARRLEVAFEAVSKPHENAGDVADVFVYGPPERGDSR